MCSRHRTTAIPSHILLTDSPHLQVAFIGSVRHMFEAPRHSLLPVMRRAWLIELIVPARACVLCVLCVCLLQGRARVCVCARARVYIYVYVCVYVYVYVWVGG